MPTAAVALVDDRSSEPARHVDAVLLSGTNWGVVRSSSEVPRQMTPRSKRALDLVGGILLLLLVLPILVLCALAVKLCDGGPVLFRQRRLGHGGRPFVMLKLRTMRVGAEALAPRLSSVDYTDGLLFRVPADPRVTSVGRVLRRTAIDELPQLWNVLRGDMSLVGPRPLPAGEEAFAPHEHLRHSVKPGLTGAWQVAGGNDLPWRAMIDLDLDYVQQWSLRRDLAILARTVPALVSRVGPS